MKKIRILYTIPNFDTAGSGKVVYDLAKNLDRDLFEVEIACSHDRGKFFKIVEDLGLKIHVFNTTTDYRPFGTLPFRVLKIARFFRRNKFDIIHSWHWSSDWTEVLAARLTGTKWIYTKKAMSWGSPRSWKLRSRLANFITTINPDMEQVYFKNYRNIKMLPLGLDTNYYMAQPKLYSAEGISYPQDEFVVISVVNLIKSKGLEVLVDAFRLLDNEKIKLLVVGDYSSEYGMSIYNKVNSDGLRDRIKFTGKVLDVRPYIALSDVFVTPTNVNWEGMPMAPVEAMSSARIVIGTDTSGINFILKGFEQFLVPPSDAKAIADKIVMVKNMTTDERNRIAQKIRDKVCSAFTVQTFVNNYQKLYQELCR